MQVVPCEVGGNGGAHLRKDNRIGHIESVYLEDFRPGLAGYDFEPVQLGALSTGANVVRFDEKKVKHLLGLNSGEHNVLDRTFHEVLSPL